MRPKKTVFKNAEIPGRIARLQPFLSEGRLPDGTRRWSAFSRPVLGYGHLPARLRSSVDRAMYVVYSYDTPIAWVTENEGHDEGRSADVTYHVPDVGYSPTTGQQQWSCLSAWGWTARNDGGIERHGRREVVQVPGNAEVYGQERRLRAGGMDGALPGSVVGGERRSAYEGVTGDAMHYTPSAVWPMDRSHP
jgi:hypothetical protein